MKIRNRRIISSNPPLRWALLLVAACVFVLNQLGRLFTLGWSCGGGVDPSRSLLMTTQSNSILLSDNNNNNDLLAEHSSSSSSPWQIKQEGSIRRWGCQLKQTPLIFVHIGKSGGGTVKQRLLSSSSPGPSKDGLRYYHITDNDNDNVNDTTTTTTQVAASVCKSCFPNFRPSSEMTYEGTLPCHASTPIGQALACPRPLLNWANEYDDGYKLCHVDSETCQIVYMGHNYMGSEMHWLPWRFLKRWWIKEWGGSGILGDDNDDDGVIAWKTLQTNATTWWCPSRNITRPNKTSHYKRVYEECSIPLAREVDARTTQVVSQKLNDVSSMITTQRQQHSPSPVVTSWSPVYASLPVLRVTVMRDPFRWLLSKYFWHLEEEDGEEAARACDDLHNALIRNAGLPRPHTIDMDNSGPGWMTRMALGHIMYLCGEDCVVRYAAGTATLADLQRQAEENLRHAFAVVGLLEEIDTFYDMIAARVQYMDPTKKSNDDSRDRHNSFSTKHCKARFDDATFRTKVLQESPEVRVLNHLYQVAIEVNRFQLNELRECSPDKFPDS